MNTFSFHLKLDSNTLQLPDIKRFIGKEVIITIIELPQDRQFKRRNWHFLGAVNMVKKMDNLNIRDLAY